MAPAPSVVGVLVEKLRRAHTHEQEQFSLPRGPVSGAENMEWDLEEALFRVHKSNMSKLGLDGKPIRREDGKILKGPNYQPPKLDDLV